MMRYAYATLITRQSYLAGVVILAHTLRKRGSRYPLIVLYTAKLSRDAVRALELEAGKSNIIPRLCDYLLPPAGTKINLIAQRFEDTWTKLRVFEISGYDAICYLDADMACFGNMDTVFDRAPELPPDWLAAEPACVCNLDSDPWAPDDWRPENCAYTALRGPAALAGWTKPAEDAPRTHHLLNGGVFLFHPSAGLWDGILTELRTSPLLSAFQFPDQDFLAHFFRGRWRSLGWRYNALKTMRYWHADLWRDDHVLGLHYIVDKPWTRRLGPDAVAGYNGLDGVTHRWWWEAYAAWEDERRNDRRGGPDAVVLVRKGVAPPEGSHDWRVDGDVDEDMKAIGAAVQAFANNKVASSVMV